MRFIKKQNPWRLREKKNQNNKKKINGMHIPDPEKLIFISFVREKNATIACVVLNSLEMLLGLVSV